MMIMGRNGIVGRITGAHSRVRSPLRRLFGIDVLGAEFEVGNDGLSADLKNFSLLDLSLSPLGLVRLTYGSDHKPQLRLRFSGAVGKRDVDLGQGELAKVNLLRTAGTTPVWRFVAGQRDAKVGVNFLPQWALPFEDTSYIQTFDNSDTDEPVVVILSDPLTDAFTPVAPFERYTFQMLGAAHRCEGELRLTVMDASRQVICTYSTAFDPQLMGGRDPARYRDLRIDFIAPANAALISVSVEKKPGRTFPRAQPDSYLFFADPILVSGAGAELEGPAVRLPAAFLSHLRRNASFKIHTVATAAPPDILSRGTFNITLLRPYRAQLAADLSLLARAKVEVRDLLIYDNQVSVAGSINGTEAPPQLAIFVDGVESSPLAVELSGQTFSGRGEIDQLHLDGRRHSIDVRILPGKEVVAARRAILGVPETGGVWSRRISEVESDLRHARVESEMLRESLDAARLAGGAAVKLREQLGAVSPLLHDISAGLKLLEDGLGNAPTPLTAPNIRRPETREEAELSASVLFAVDWYTKTQMPAGDKAAPARHYLAIGAAAGSQPHPLFSAGWYKKHFMEQSDKELPFVHFLRNGTKLQYAPHPLFDLTWFLAQYKRENLVDAMVFFHRNADEHDLDPHPLFLTKWYLDTYPQVRSKFTIALQHYMTEGAAQQFWPNPLFDPAYYIRSYSHVMEDAANPLQHFIEYGSDEGFNPNPLFSTAWYRASNRDVSKEHWLPLAHYLRVGGPAGLDPSLSFDTAAYRAKHPNLDITKESALAHFLRSRRKDPTASVARHASLKATAMDGTFKADPAPEPVVPSLASVSRPPQPALNSRLAGAGSTELATPLINWVIGPRSNAGWAYGNNANRLAEKLTAWRHEISGEEDADVVLYFDVLVADRFPSAGKRKIVRVGGARPLDRLFGDDPERLREGLAHYDAVINLSPSLQRRAAAVHPNSIFIPNGIDLTKWRPETLQRDDSRVFTAGFAASVMSRVEREVKGYDLAMEAARLANVPLLSTHKGVDQIRHDRMIEDFYSKIDVLLHPVAPGREGSSNVIMEAIALGIPVITTEHSGFHGECLIDGEEALIRGRNVEHLAKALIELREDREKVARVGAAARQFALRHHDIEHVAAQYGEVFRQALVYGGERRSSVAFKPFWKPSAEFASSRLRADFPAALVSAAPSPITVVGEEIEKAETVLIVQSAEDPVFDQLKQRPEAFVIYDVCDRYFENPKVFKTPSGEVNSLARFNELMDRANVVITPTIELKAELASRFPMKPVYCVPEMIDYSRGFRNASPVSPKRVVWFGSPQRGNFDSARWLLDAMTGMLGYDLRLVSRRGYFSRMPQYRPHVVDWALETFLPELQAASICVVTHAEDEKTKSPNRFVTAVAHGVPTIVSNSRPSAALLRAAGCEWAIVSNVEELEQAVRRLEMPAERHAYLQRVQATIEAEHGDRAVRTAYLQLFLNRVYDTKAARRKRVAFVSHNLNFGEGAPKSLYETILGLREHAQIEPFVYCASRGDLEGHYAEAAVPLRTFSGERRPPMREVNNRFEAVRHDFKMFLKENAIEHVVANTIKSASFASFAHELGIPASIIIRESFAKDKRFDYYAPEPRKAAELGLMTAKNVVFVSSNTMRLWSDQPMSPDTRLIKNGVNIVPYKAALSVERSSARANLGLSGAEIVAICVGTVNERKGQFELLRWYTELPPAVRERLTILFVGATDNRGLEQFRSIYDGLPAEIQARLVVVPTTPDIGMYYRASDFFLMNSSQESYPRSTMEALLFGLPVVSTPVFGVLEQIVDGDNGFIYSYNDGAAWIRSVCTLVVDDRRRSAMAAAAASSFWKLTTYAEMIHDYHCVISPPKP